MLRLGRACLRAMCVDRLLVETCSPQNLQRALPGEMKTRCIPASMSGTAVDVKPGTLPHKQAGRWSRMGVGFAGAAQRPDSASSTPKNAGLGRWAP